MKPLLASLILLLTVYLAIGVNAEEDEVVESEPESEVPAEETEDESSTPDAEEQSTDSEETKPSAEEETKEADESTPPPPTTPWKRLPVTTKVPVNYDIDLPQDI